MQWLNFIVHCKVLFNNHKIFQICYGDFINNIEGPSILWQKYCFPTFDLKEIKTILLPRLLPESTIDSTDPELFGLIYQNSTLPFNG
jgi:hypothetical protein